MSNSDFEKNVQDELDDLSFEPSDEVWDRVEANLPEKNRRRGLLLLIPLFILSGIVFIPHFLNPSEESKQRASDRPVVSQKSSERSKSFPLTGNSGPTQDDSADVKPPDNENNANVKQDEMTISGAGSKKSTEKIFSQTKTRPSKNNVVQLSDPGRLTVTMRNAIPESDVESELVSRPASIPGNVESSVTSSAKPDTSIPSNVSPPKTDKLIVIESTDTIVKDLAKERKKKVNAKWILGMTAGAGISNSKSGLFSKNQMYADVLSSGSPSGIPASPSSSNTKPNKPTASFAFTAGLSLDRNISNRITFHTGLNYAYLSSRIAVGTKVDSSGRFLTNSGSAFVDSYYRNGSTGNYLNKFHFISLPVALQFRPSDKLPLYGEVGLTTSLLINSNVLQYSSGNNAYFKNADSHNRMIFGMQAGIGIHLKTLALGYRFNHSLGSVVKDASSQYPVSSIIYVQLPLKRF